MNFHILLLVPVAMAFPRRWNRSLTKMEDQIHLHLDRNQDGFITVDEAAGYFTNYDTNNDGIITFEEFDKGVDNADQIFKGKELLLFNLFDRNNDGVFTESDIVAVFTFGDTDHDTFLTTDEIDNLVTVTADYVAVHGLIG
ncbi:hypothetical protein BsWGS_07059 [Bradybaena similaris]